MIMKLACGKLPEYVQFEHLAVEPVEDDDHQSAQRQGRLHLVESSYELGHDFHLRRNKIAPQRQQHVTKCLWFNTFPVPTCYRMSLSLAGARIALEFFTIKT